MSEDASTMLLGIGISSALLFLGAVVLFLREKSGSSLIQLVGAGCLLVVVAAHVSEALQLFPWMQWGLPHSLGHYVTFTRPVGSFIWNRHGTSSPSKPRRIGPTAPVVLVIAPAMS